MKQVNVVVKKEFLDRYTGLKRKPGEKLTITDARYREIKRSGDYVEIDKDSSAADSKKENK